MCMTCRSFWLARDPSAGNKLLTCSSDIREPVNVQSDKENTNMKLLKLTFVLSVLVVLGGCVAVPVGPGYYGGSPGYYDAPAPAYYAPPVYYGPPIGIGIYGGRRGYGRGYGYR